MIRDTGGEGRSLCQTVRGVPFERELGQFEDTRKGVRPFQEFGDSSTVQGSDRPTDVRVWVSDSLSCPSRTGRVSGTRVFVPDSLSEHPTGTVCVGVRLLGVRLTRLTMDTRPELFVGVPGMDHLWRSDRHFGVRTRGSALL